MEESENYITYQKSTDRNGWSEVIGIIMDVSEEEWEKIRKFLTLLRKFNEKKKNN